MNESSKKRIPIAEPNIGILEKEYVTDALDSGWISSSGGYIEKFEKSFAKYSDTRYAVSTFNGTVALTLALAAIGIKPGDEVIVPSLTFMASAATIIHQGARPVFVDSNDSHWCMDVSSLESYITEKTRAIMPVHLYGHPCNMDEINEIAEKHGLFVIEDAAEAHGAEYKGKRVGGLGDVGCFSFYANKIITTGEGGIVTTSNDELLEKMELLKNHGMPKDRKYWHPVIGFNFRMINLQAALGLAQMNRIDDFIKKKIVIARKYMSAFENNPSISYQQTMQWAKNVYWMFSIRLPSEQARVNLSDKLGMENIDTRPLFIPCNEQPSILDLYSDLRTTPSAAAISRTGLLLPSGTLLNESDLNRVIDAILESDSN